MDSQPRPRIGVIGTRWGKVHLDILSELGCPASVVMGQDPVRTAKMAAELGIERHTTDSAGLEGCDLVCIASPAATHLAFLEQFASLPIICEKPLFAGRIPSAQLKVLAQRPILVNYAFRFLDAIAELEAAVRNGSIGDLQAVTLGMGIHFHGTWNPDSYLRDVVCHELTWLSQWLGPLRLNKAALQATEERLVAGLMAGETAVELRMHEAKTFGIHIAIHCQGSNGHLSRRGGWQGQVGWNFGPLYRNGNPVTPCQLSKPGADLWYIANREWFRAALATFFDRQTQAQPNSMLCDPVAAAAIDSLVCDLIDHLAIPQSA